ncbi:MAG: MotA/TolQ/ExbB proton channel family protein [Breznakibacter sp.]
MSILSLLEKGGWMMIPILLLSLMAVAIFIERYLTIKKASRTEKDFINRIRDYITDGKLESAQKMCENSQQPSARMIEKGIRRIGRSVKEIEESIEIVGKFEVYRLERYLPVLGVIAGIAPMFGFVGTVMGVIKIFYNISLADNISIGLIAGGLYEKMVSTASGLIVGIVAFIAYHWLNTMVEKVVHQMEFDAMSFIDILQEPISHESSKQK